MSKFDKYETTRKEYETQLYNEIQTAIINWNNDGTKTAGELTREIIKLLKKPRWNKIKTITHGNLETDKLIP